MRSFSNFSSLYLWVLLTGFIVTAIVYWPGLHGGFLFDDYPNIVDNQGVQPHDASLPSLVRAVLASPASDFKRPLASLSFAANYLVTGLDPYWMKLTNLGLHLLNGLLVFLLARLLLRSDPSEDQRFHSGIVAALIATGWVLLPINLTSVLYIVQRMESIANLFVLLGLIGYVISRRRMLGLPVIARSTPTLLRRGKLGLGRFSSSTRDFTLCLISITIPTVVGILAKETAVMLPLYALLIEWSLFRFCKPLEISATPQNGEAKTRHRDNRIIGLFVSVLISPMFLGLAWLLPGILKPGAWATRDFTLGTRLLSEARIVVDYIAWTLLPTPSALSFYHDDFRISTGFLTPPATLASIALLATLITLMLGLRSRKPLAALGIALFLGCQLLTGTILPLELIYEHRNYFASFGLLLAVVPLLAAPRASPFALPRWVLLAGLMLCWATLTGLTARAWSNPLRLAEDLAARAPQSPRAQYELGRTYIIYSHYDPASPFTQLAYAPLEKSAALPDSSILPEQALIFMNARMHLPLKDAWWDSLIAKLQARKPGVQDESSLGALTQCAREDRCKLPSDRMIGSFMAALAHPNPSARLLATYGDYAWNVLNDHVLGERMAEEAVNSSPDEPAYRITLIRMLTALDKTDEARKAYLQLETLNIGGRLDSSLAELRAQLPAPIPNNTPGIK
jgi:protein O-mannosyl-transferase